MQRSSVVLFAVLVVAAVLRFASLDLDPTAAFGTDFLTDEGFYAKNARLRVLTGAWLAPGDDHNHLFLAPLHVAVNAVAFAAVGPSLAAARMVAALAGLTLVMVVAVWLQRAAGGWAAVLAASLIAVDPALVHLSRVALSEGLLALAGVAVFVALTWRPWSTAGVVAMVALWAVALAVKGSAVALLPGLVLGIGLIGWLEAGTGVRGRRIVGAMVGLVFGVLVVLGIWWFAVVGAIPEMAFIYRFESGVHVGRLSAERLRQGLAYAIETKHFLVGLGRSPLLAHVALLAPVLLLTGGRELPRPAARVAAAATGWLIGQAGFHSLLPYQPYRYFLALSLPAAVLAGIWGSAAPALLAARRSPVRQVVVAISWAAAATLAVHQWRTQLGPAAHAGSIALGIACTIPLLLAVRGVVGMAPLVTLLAVGAALLALPSTTAPFRAGRHDDRIARERLASQLVPSDVVVGFFADTVVLDGRAGAVVVHGAWNAGPDPIRRFGVTKLLVAPAEVRWLCDRNPGLADRLRELDRVTTRRAELTLYAVAAAAGERALAATAAAGNGP